MCKESRGLSRKVLKSPAFDENFPGAHRLHPVDPVMNPFSQNKLKILCVENRRAGEPFIPEYVAGGHDSHNVYSDFSLSQPMPHHPATLLPHFSRLAFDGIDTVLFSIEQLPHVKASTAPIADRTGK